jgi:hypothetical protein
MKKLFFVLFVMVIATSAFAEKGEMYLGPELGIALPTGDAGDYYTISPVIGARFLYGLNNQMALEGNIDYMILQPKEDWSGFSASNIAISAALRYSTNDKVYFGGGLSINMISSSYDDPHWGNIEIASDSQLGIFGLAGIRFEKGSFDIDPQLRLSLTDGNLWITAGVGLNFPIGGK